MAVTLATLKTATGASRSIIDALSAVNMRYQADGGMLRGQDRRLASLTGAVGPVASPFLVGFVVPPHTADFKPVIAVRPSLSAPGRAGMLRNGETGQQSVDLLMKPGSDAETDPMGLIGRNPTVATGRRAQAAQAQVNEINSQLRALAAVPPLSLMVNPSSFARRHEATVDYANGRRKPIVSMWLEKPTTITASGASAAQYAIARDGSGGITAASRVSSLSYENLMSLVAIYRNNGILYAGNMWPSYANGGVPIRAISTFIHYDNMVYVGSFDDFSVTDSEDTPYNMKYSFSFTARYQAQVSGE